VAKDGHPQASIDWDSAAVKDGDLTVALTGEPNNEWARRVQAVLERLDPARSSAGAAKVTKTHIEVNAVVAGAEDDLRHLLESAVQQANADFAPAEESDHDEPSEADSAMTEAFRSFAGDRPEDEEDPQQG
jgi:hypothetical protein